ncbi:hypothetical protein [Haliea sp. E17]|uniref:hypothetical protein n=1 Tax=Haliea sp. E17 TaxID=3401576 RepID=UPI003AAFFA74
MTHPQTPAHTDAAEELREYVASSDLPRLFPRQFSTAQIQWVMRQRHVNGLEHAVIRLGKKLYVHLPSFRDWVVAQRN